MSSLDEFRSSKAIREWPIVLLRVYTGIFFLKFGWGKITNPNFSDGLVGFLGSRSESTFAFYQPFLEAVVLPNKGLFAFLVGYGEVALGIALILGLATRYAAFAGVFLVANFWFAKGQGILDAQNHDVIWVVILIVLAGLHAGRALSLDQKLVGRFKFLA
jgi:thiosulfate dehydrogenase [quinone] large subunit